MQLNINAEFDKLIEKYHIEHCETPYKLQKAMNEIFHNIDENLTLVIRGGGEHTEKLLESLDEENKRKIDYIVDQQVRQEFISGIKVITLEEMCNMQVDVIVVSSYAHRTDILRELFSLIQNVKIIELYDSLEKRGIKCENAFYVMRGYADVYCIEQCYKRAETKEHKQYYLQKLIGYYLGLRDFVNAQTSIEEYAKQGYAGKENYLQFWSEWEKLYEKIRKAFGERKEKDIVINWVDALRYKELPNMKYLSRMRQKSIFFENAYTIMPWTTMTLVMIMTNQLVIDDKLYKIRLLDENNAVFLRYLKEKGYAFKYVGNSKSIRKRFARENLISGITRTGENDNVSRQQWNAMNEMLLSEKPMCVIIHNIAETHGPFWGCGTGTLLDINQNKKYPDKCLEQLEESRTYLDGQLEWYQSLYGDAVVNIMMSDHGKTPVESMGTWLGHKSDDMVHICMMVYGNGIASRQVKQLFQVNDIIKLLHYIIEPEQYKLEDAYRDGIHIQALDTYDAHLVSVLLAGTDRSLCNWVQYRGIRTEQELYIRDVIGRELYVRYPDTEENLIDSSEFQDRIAQLRHMDKGAFINVYKDEYFKESLRIYERLGISEEDINRVNQQG